MRPVCLVEIPRLVALEFLPVIDGHRELDHLREHALVHIGTPEVTFDDEAASHVDVLRKTVTIAEQVTRGRGGAGDIGPPKTAAARRTISIPNELADEVSSHMKSIGLTGADPDELLFPNQDGKPLDYSNWRGRVWELATKAAATVWGGD